MAKKFEIPRELEDALRKANVPEEKIAELGEAADVQSVPLEALDGVSGGTGQTVNMGGAEISRAEFDALFLSMAENFGFFTASSIFKQYCDGFTCEELQPGHTFNTLHCTDKDVMGAVLYRYWLWRETGSPYAHP